MPPYRAWQSHRQTADPSISEPAIARGRNASTGQEVIAFEAIQSRRLQMQWSHSGKFAFFLAAALALGVSGCSSEPTATDQGVVPHSGTASAITLTVGGPDSIWVSGNYQFGAFYNGLYPQVLLYTRTCTTLTVSTCATAWAQVTNVNWDGQQHWYFNRSLAKDCTFNGKKSFQVKGTASGFGQPQQTAYHVTKLCGTNPAI
jgi:hypothetical protein